MDGSGEVVVVATMRAQPGRLAELVDQLDGHARRTLEHEPGCLQFDVVLDGERPDTVWLYEVYRDDAAFAVHRAQPYMVTNRARLDELAGERSVTTHRRLRHPMRPTPEPKGAAKILLAAPSLAARPASLAPLGQAGFELVPNPHGATLTPAQLAVLLPGCAGVISEFEIWDVAAFAAAGPELRVLALLGGMDRVDLAAAGRRGVATLDVHEADHEAVADFAFALIAATAHRLTDYDRRVRAGAWDGGDGSAAIGHAQLHGACLGIVGFGRAGRALAKRAQGFGMDILVADPLVDAPGVGLLGGRLLPLDELLAAADIVSLHGASGPEPGPPIDARRLALMKPGALLVSTAPGGLVDEVALAAALEEGRLAGAALDAFAGQPPGPGPALLAAPNALLTPQVAGASEARIEAGIRRAVEAVLAVLAGQEPMPGLAAEPSAARSATSGEVAAEAARPL